MALLSINVVVNSPILPLDSKTVISSLGALAKRQLLADKGHSALQGIGSTRRDRQGPQKNNARIVRALS